ncbi:PhnA domain-containing protein [Lishizhenia sp.]|uniref:PhnA domain-containing protein n=1 Tax=Lishizhenia sp. TaxID=2497594 RepID=UPI00299EB0E3|nr:PhnA domain-containing protein [Lishizhenia sp.]MDX1445407.1 PhnA domain-containing protein [Lishizhenia sp.]
MKKELTKRSNGNCEICGAEATAIYTVAPKDANDINGNVHLCSTCNDQLTGAAEVDGNHWRCLNDAMWSEVDAVKVIAYRMLHQLKGEGWPMDLIDMIYLEDDVLTWAKEGVEDENAVKHVDSNGAVLENGDSVVLIKDLKVKGGGFTAKRGTAVRNITLVQDNPEHIEGKVEGQRIVILTQYVKK